NETTSEYDDASNLIRETDDRGISTVTLYDGMNRPVAVYDEADREGTVINTFYDATSGCESSFCSNGEGQTVLMTYPGVGDEPIVERFGYDLRGRLVVSSRLLKGYDFVLNNSYDNADRLLNITYPDGRSIDYQYDNADRLTMIEGVVTEVTHDVRSQVSQIVYADGTRTTTDYDENQRITQRLTRDAMDVVLQGFEYSYDR
ncbi:MAG: RHS repeat domain-containing protein, partial [Myxococcota bacterium]